MICSVTTCNPYLVISSKQHSSQCPQLETKACPDSRQRRNIPGEAGHRSLRELKLTAGHRSKEEIVTFANSSKNIPCVSLLCDSLHVDMSWAHLLHVHTDALAQIKHLATVPKVAANEQYAFADLRHLTQLKTFKMLSEDMTFKQTQSYTARASVLLPWNSLQ